MWEKIQKIEELGYDEAIDIEVSGNHLFYANDILTHNSNSDVDLTDTSESFGLPATADMMFAVINSEEMEELGQLMVKQLKNRFSDPAKFRRFVVGVDRRKMRLYDVEESAQDLIDDGPIMDKTNVGRSIDDEESESRPRGKFKRKFGL
jgi:hypothetical protein